jgi:hypothetical protein
MSLTIDTTLGGEFSNSYVDLTYADDYWENHYSSVKAAQWAALSDEQKSQLLIRACRVLETARFTIPVTLPEYAIHYDRTTGKVLDLNLTTQPVKFYYSQRLQFPRNLDFVKMGPNGDLNLGDLYIPSEVQIAQVEQAMYMLNLDDGAIANRIQGITMDKFSVGKGQVDATQEYAVTGSMFAPLTLEMLRPLMVRGGRLQRG